MVIVVLWNIDGRPSWSRPRLGLEVCFFRLFVIDRPFLTPSLITVFSPTFRVGTDQHDRVIELGIRMMSYWTIGQKVIRANQQSIDINDVVVLLRFLIFLAVLVLFVLWRILWAKSQPWCSLWASVRTPARFLLLWARVT